MSTKSVPTFKVTLRFVKDWLSSGESRLTGTMPWAERYQYDAAKMIQVYVARTNHLKCPPDRRLAGKRGPRLVRNCISASETDKVPVRKSVRAAVLDRLVDAMTAINCKANALKRRAGVLPIDQKRLRPRRER